jgi:hypothetical protein
LKQIWDFASGGEPMAFCPKCRYEYREGFTTCADCGAALVNALPETPVETETPSPAEDELVAVYEAKDELQAATLKQVLEEAGIPVVEKEYRAHGAFGAVQDIGMVTPFSYSRLFTSASRAEEAKRIVADFLAAYERGDLELPE